MTDIESEEPPTRPRSVIQAVPLQEVPSEDVPDDDVSDEDVPFQAMRPQAVPSQAVPYRERQEPATDDDADVVTPADDDVALAPADDDVVPTPANDDKLLLLAEADELRAGWQMIRAGFIDDPRASVAEAANVVEKAAEMLVAALRAQQDQIRDSWDDNGSGIDTESMRQALLTYQSLFNRIAS
ncbi:MAG TPA: hypothetical protein VI365_26570 [Trebonia sp.]